MYAYEKTNNNAWFEATLRFSKWLRRHDENGSGELHQRKYHFSYSDKDGQFWQWKNTVFRYFIVEQKLFDEIRKKSQEDAFKMFDAIGRYSDGKRIDGYVIQYWGLHLLEIDGIDPDNSNKMLWNGQEIKLSELFQILRFERSPEFKNVMRNIGPNHWR